MSSSHLPDGALAALTDKELEILRLLASGHTAKSIAVRLKRSETSINERLRDARRKTGVGSSRELARLLDAQKIWDKNIDLPASQVRTDKQAWPADKGHALPKGTLFMFITLPIAIAGLALAAVSTERPEEPPASDAAAPSPLVGRWSLDVARIPAEERPQAVTIAFSVSTANAWTTRVDIVGADGSLQHAQSTAVPDGVAVPISGNMPFIDTVSLRQPAPGTLVMTLGKGGAPVSTRVYTVAKDGQSMTETIVWAGERLPDMPTARFTRAG